MMTKTKTAEALARTNLKRAASIQNREGLANLAAATVAMKIASDFIDMDFALGVMKYAASLPAAKKLKMIEVGREVRMGLLPTVFGDDATVDLVVRVPGDHADLSEVAKQLIGLGLRQNRKRTESLFVEFTGSADEAAVHAIVEPAGGRVTAIASPSHVGAPPVPDRDEEPATRETPAGETTSDAEASAGEDGIPAKEHEPGMKFDEAGGDREGADAPMPDEDGPENYPGAIPGEYGKHSDPAPFFGP